MRHFEPRSYEQFPNRENSAKSSAYGIVQGQANWFGDQRGNDAVDFYKNHPVEPTTPEEQVLFTEDGINDSIPSQSRVPGLTPDGLMNQARRTLSRDSTPSRAPVSSTLQRNKPHGLALNLPPVRDSQYSVPRKPVPSSTSTTRSNFSIFNPVRPLRLFGNSKDVQQLDMDAAPRPSTAETGPVSTKPHAIETNTNTFGSNRDRRIAKVRNWNAISQSSDSDLGQLIGYSTSAKSAVSTSSLGAVSNQSSAPTFSPGFDPTKNTSILTAGESSASSFIEKALSGNESFRSPSAQTGYAIPKRTWPDSPSVLKSPLRTSTSNSSFKLDKRIPGDESSGLERTHNIDIPARPVTDKNATQAYRAHSPVSIKSFIPVALDDDLTSAGLNASSFPDDASAEEILTLGPPLSNVTTSHLNRSINHGPQVEPAAYNVPTSLTSERMSWGVASFSSLGSSLDDIRIRSPTSPDSASSDDVSIALSSLRVHPPAFPPWETDEEKADGSHYDPDNTNDKQITTTFHDYINSLPEDGVLTHIVEPKSTGFPLKVVSAVDANVEKKEAKVALLFQVPRSRYNKDVFMNMNTAYQNDARDVARSVELKQKIQACKLIDRHMSSVQTGILRICSKAAVAKPGSSTAICANADILLFDKVFIILDKDHIVAAMDTDAFLIRANIDSRNPAVLNVRFQADEVRELDIQMESPAAALAWEKAILHKKAQFPTDPINWEKYLKKLEMQMDSSEAIARTSRYRLPAEIVICLPQKIITHNRKVKKQLIKAMGTSLDNEDRIAFIIYSDSGEVADYMSLQLPQWNEWRTFFNSLEKIRETSDSSNSNGGKSGLPAPVTADTVLRKAKSLLHNEFERYGTASIIFVTDGPLNLESSLEIFDDSDISICSLGVGADSDALALTALASATRGSYHYQEDPEHLVRMLAMLLKSESQYVFRDLTVKIRPRIGCKISNVVNNLRVLSRANQLQEVQLGKMRMGDFKSILIDICGELVPTQPLLQASIDARQFNRGGASPLKLRAIRLHTPEPEEPEHLPLAIVYSEVIINASFLAVCQALTELLNSDRQKAFIAVASGLDTIQRLKDVAGLRCSMPKELQSVLDTVTHTTEEYSEQLLDENISLRELLRLTLGTTWMIETRRALSPKTALGKLFK